MRTEEANHLKEKMEEFSLNSSKANLVESFGTVMKDTLKGKKKKVSKKELMKKKNQFNKSESQFQNLRVLVLFVEKFITLPPGAIKEKGRTQRRKDKVMSKTILLKVMKWLLL